MIKRYLLLVISVFCITLAFGQHVPIQFGKGLIITENDSINCFVELRGTYPSSFKYKKSKSGRTHTVNVDSVHCIITDYCIFQNITLNRKSIGLLKEICSGKISLYLDLSRSEKWYPNEESLRNREIDIKANDYNREDFIERRHDFIEMRYKETYYIKKADKVIKLPYKRISRDVLEFFADDHFVYSDVKKMKKINVLELTKLIQKYNEI